MIDRWQNISMQTRFERKYIPEPNSGCWLWIGNLFVSGGYGDFKENGKRIRAHVYSYKIHKGEIPSGKFVLHTCDMPCCVNPDHLYAGTPKQNTDDCIERNRFPYGIKHGMAKLTEEQVRAIRVDSRLHRIIALEYGLDRAYVGQIKNRISWKHI
jgi:HNH endonuclease